MTNPFPMAIMKVMKTLHFKYRNLFILTMLLFAFASSSLSSEIVFVSQHTGGELMEVIEGMVVSFESVQDYEATFTKVELIGRKYVQDVIKFSFKKPKLIRMEWVGPRKVRGQLAVYDPELGKIRASPARLPITVTLDPEDKRVTGGSKYRIYDSDLGAITERVINTARDASSIDLIENDDHVLKVLIITDTLKGIIWIDRNIGLPIKIEQYDHKDQLIDRVFLENLKINIGLPDDMFHL